MTTTKRRYELTDQEWDRIKDYFPQQTKSRPHNDIRTTINGILCKLFLAEREAQGKGVELLLLPLTQLCVLIHGIVPP